jgi:hypothetical protein
MAKDYGRKQKERPVDMTSPVVWEQRGAAMSWHITDYVNRIASLPTEMDRPDNSHRYPSRPHHSAALPDIDQ